MGSETEPYERLGDTLCWMVLGVEQELPLSCAKSGCSCGPDMVLDREGRLRSCLLPTDCLESMLWHLYLSYAPLETPVSFNSAEFFMWENPSDAVLLRISASV